MTGVTASCPAIRSPAIPAPTLPALELEGLTKRFGPVLAVDNLTFTVSRGEVLGLLGPNGSGKSTTLNMIMGFVRPTAGKIVIDGHDLARDRVGALASVGGLVEGSAFYPYLSGRKNLSLLARIQGLPLHKVEQVLDLVDLRQAADRQFGGYSMGMRQRLGVAAALMHDPRLVIFDEPTSGLDPAGTREMRQLIPRIAGEGKTVVLASHLLVEVEQVCQRVIILKEGRVIAQGAVEKLLHREGVLRVGVATSELNRARSVLEGHASVAKVSVEDGALLVEAAADGSILNRVLAEAGIYASEIARASRSLESVFLELTESEPNS
jgi:ABC-2 type transport system ATP-binding protein